MGSLRPDARVVPGGLPLFGTTPVSPVDPPTLLTHADDAKEGPKASTPKASTDSPPEAPQDSSESDDARLASRFDTQLSTGPQRRQRLPPEVLIIVRSRLKRQHHHPYNLQVQLVSPNPVGTEAGDSDSISRGGRTFSGSECGSTTGSENNAGFSNDTLQGAKVVPLYNVVYHHVLPSLLLDACTDERVTKYSRRGVDIQGMGLLVPRELVRGVNDVATMRYCLGTHITGTSCGPPPSITPSTRTSLDSPRAGSLDLPNEHSSSGEEAEPVPPSKDHGLIKRLRKRFGRTPHMAPVQQPDERPASSPTRRSRSSSQPQALDEAREARKRSVSPPLRPESEKQLPSIPLLQPGAGTARGHYTEGYWWEVTRYSRNVPLLPQEDQTEGEEKDPMEYADESLTTQVDNPALALIRSHLKTLGNLRGSGQPVPGHTVPVRFEWVRDRPRMMRSPTRGRTRKSRYGSDSNSGHSSIGDQTPAMPRLEIGAPRVDASPERMSLNGRMRSPPPSSGTERTSFETDSSGESAPVAWTCSLVLDEITRINIGQLMTAPHHPMVVGQITLPFPLPDLRSSGLGADGYGFSREELKDIVVTTAVHLVMREEFGRKDTKN